MNKNEIITKIIYASNILYKKIYSHEDRIKIGLEANSLYEKLDYIEKRKVIVDIYIIYRELGALYYSTNSEYESAEIFFEKSLCMKKEKNDIDALKNECITKQMLSKVKMMIYLNSLDEKKLVQAKEHIEFLYKNYDENWDEQFKKLVNEVFEIYDKILKNDIKSIVTFKIPYHLLIGDNEEIKFKYNEIECSIKSETIRSVESGFIQGENLFTEKDKYGIINNSIITLKIGKYINIWDLIEVNKAIGTVRNPLKEAIDIYNYFLKNYIVATNKYWLPEINENMIINTQTVVYVGEIEVHNVPLSMNLTLSSTGNNELKLVDTDIEKIKEEIENPSMEIWKLSLNNAKDYYLIKDYKNAIIMINIAFENFTFAFAKEKLKKHMTKEELECFLSGRVLYKDYFLKDYITEENFNKAKQKDIIKDNPPTIYKIFNECYKYEELPLSKSQLNKKIFKIKDQRNEIVHGIKISKDLRYVAEKSINEFENLVELLENKV